MNNAQLKGMRMMAETVIKKADDKIRGNGLYDPWKCPVCKDMVTDFPALSRKDNKTEICSDCGTREALDDYFNFR